MSDPGFLIGISVVTSVLLLGVSFYLLIYYSHPDDRNNSYIPKIIVVLSLTIAEMNVILIALDVANQGGSATCGRLTSYTFPVATTSGDNTTSTTSTQTVTALCPSLSIGTMWTVMFFVVTVFVALLIPFMIFFYEAADAGGRKCQSRCCEALQYQGVAVFLIGLALGLMFAYINTFTYPLRTIPYDLVTNAPITCSGQQYCVEGSPTYFNPNTTDLVISTGSGLVTDEQKQYISLVPNSFGVYLGSFLSFLGWWLFCIYTGVGLITLPIDLIKSYRYRPKYMPKDVYIRLREDLRLRVDQLQKLGEKMKNERGRYDTEKKNQSFFSYIADSTEGKQRSVFKQFKKEVEQVEADYEDIRVCHEAWSSYNPLIPFVYLFFGIIAFILSICWILQICLFILPQYWPNAAGYIPTYLLNDLITWGLIYSGFSLLGVVFIGLFGLYLFLCNLNGSFKIGLRFLIMEIYPMKVGATYMSSFLVNVIILLLQTPALVNFIALAFSNTVVLTDVDSIMNVAVRYTTFFIYFFDNNVFIFLLLAFSVLAMCLLWAIPDDAKKNQKRLKNKIEKMENDLLEKEKAEKRNKFVGKGDIGDIVKNAKESHLKKQANATSGEEVPEAQGLGVT